MNHEFTATSRKARLILAIAAVLATTLIIGSIEGLSQHYNAEAQLAGAKPVSVAQR